MNLKTSFFVFVIPILLVLNSSCGESLDIKLGPITPPVLIFPEDNDTGIYNGDTLRWRSASQENATQELTYDLYLGRIFPLERYGYNLDDTFVAVFGLQPGLQYFWKVVARDFVDDTASTTVRTFHSKTLQLPTITK